MCVTDRGGFPVHVHEGVEVSCLLVADQLQDSVMDDSGRPWPSLAWDGPGAHARVDAFGKACWQVEGRFRCPTGYLTSALKVFGIVR